MPVDNELFNYVQGKPKPGPRVGLPGQAAAPVQPGVSPDSVAQPEPRSPAVVAPMKGIAGDLHGFIQAGTPQEQAPSTPQAPVAQSPSRVGVSQESGYTSPPRFQFGRVGGGFSQVGQSPGHSTPMPQYHAPAGAPALPEVSNPVAHDFGDLFNDTEFKNYAYQNPSVMRAYLASRGDTQHATAQSMAAANGAVSDLFGSIAGSQSGNYQARQAAAASRYHADTDMFSRGKSDDAQLEMSDPNRKFAAMARAWNIPDVRRAIQGFNADPNTPTAPGAGVPTGAPIDANNLGQALAGNDKIGISGILSDPDSNLQTKLKQLVGVEGMKDPASQNHQLLQQWINREYTDPQRWREDTYLPPNPDATGMPGIISRPLGMLGAAASSLFGDTTAGTGYGWRRNYLDRSQGLDLLQQLGIAPPPGTESPDRVQSLPKTR